MDAAHGCWQNKLRKSETGTAQECYELFWTNPGSNTIQKNPQLYGYLPPFTKNYLNKMNKHTGHYWKGKDEFISNVLLWTFTNGLASVIQPARTYLHQLCGDTGYNLEELLGAMDDRERWRERERESQEYPYCQSNLMIMMT